MAVKTVVIDRYARRELTTPDAKLVAKAQESEKSDAGWLEGYAATWDNIDLSGQVMVKGCFARSIKEAVAAGKIKLMSRHFKEGGDAFECIGTITEAKEDDVGLWIRAEFAGTADAQSIRTKVVEGHVKGLSVGFMPLRYEIRNTESEDGSVRDVVAHLESKLVEVTTTVKPVNDMAEIVAAKSIPAAAHGSVAQTIGKSISASSAVAPAGKTQSPPDLPRIRRDIALKRARLSLLDTEV